MADAQTKAKPAVYADLEAVPSHLVGEIIFGSLHTHPRPVAGHSAAQSALSGELTQPFQRGRGGPGGWVFMTEPILQLGPHTLVPDLAGWRRERMPFLPSTQRIEVSPDWVCEVLSPSTEAIDRGVKLSIYATYGVCHCWLINPATKVLEAYERQASKWLLLETYSGEVDVAAEPFAEISFPLSALWPLPDAPDNQQPS